MECFAKFNPVKDIQSVDQTGFVDLVKANASGSVPSEVPVTDEKFNYMEDPRSIAGRPSDVFEAMQANVAIAGYVPPKNDVPAQE